MLPRPGGPRCHGASSPAVFGFTVATSKDFAVVVAMPRKLFAACDGANTADSVSRPTRTGTATTASIVRARMPRRDAVSGAGDSARSTDSTRARKSAPVIPDTHGTGQPEYHLQTLRMPST